MASHKQTQKFLTLDQGVKSASTMGAGALDVAGYWTQSPWFSLPEAAVTQMNLASWVSRRHLGTYTEVQWPPVHLQALCPDVQ